MTEQAPIEPSQNPETKRTPTPAEELAQLAQDYSAFSPNTLEEAQQHVQAANNVRASIKEADGGYTFLDTPVPAKTATNFLKLTDQGLDLWRKSPKARQTLETITSAQHPADLSPSQRNRMQTLKTDSMEPPALAFNRLKDDAKRQLRLDEAIAEYQGQEVASVRTAGGYQEATANKAAADLQRARTEAFKRVVTFSSKPGSEHAAGPDIRKATGLTREAILQLGYNSYAELKDAAQSWQADRDEARRVRDYHAANNAQADAWNAERAAHRDAKAAGTERVEKIAFGKKLTNGGEIALAKNPNLAARLREEAIEQAAAEGHSVGHLQSAKGREVVPAAELVAIRQQVEAARTPVTTSDDGAPESSAPAAPVSAPIKRRMRPQFAPAVYGADGKLVRRGGYIMTDSGERPPLADGETYLPPVRPSSQVSAPEPEAAPEMQPSLLEGDVMPISEVNKYAPLQVVQYLLRSREAGQPNDANLDEIVASVRAINDPEEARATLLYLRDRGFIKENRATGRFSAVDSNPHDSEKTRKEKYTENTTRLNQLRDEEAALAQVMKPGMTQEVAMANARAYIRDQVNKDPSFQKKRFMRTSKLWARREAEIERRLKTFEYSYKHGGMVNGSRDGESLASHSEVLSRRERTNRFMGELAVEGRSRTLAAARTTSERLQIPTLLNLDRMAIDGIVKVAKQRRANRREASQVNQGVGLDGIAEIFEREERLRQEQEEEEERQRVSA